LFLIHISDFPLKINSVSEPVLVTDDTNVIISSGNFRASCSVSNSGLFHVIKWFDANMLVLNLDKTNVMKFIRNNSCSTYHFGYKENNVEEAVNTEFLGLQFYNHRNWKNHIEQMIPKLSVMPLI
jgi:hypothetical protein